MERTIRLPDELLIQLEDGSWRDLLAYGSKKGRESGYTEADVPDLVREWRREHRSR